MVDVRSVLVCECRCVCVAMCVSLYAFDEASDGDDDHGALGGVDEMTTKMKRAIGMMMMMSTMMMVMMMVMGC